MGVYCIIPDYKQVAAKADIEKLKAAVFVHLYYEEQVGVYQEYLKQIPDFMDIAVISSKDLILDSFDDNRFIKIKKENRGRDISALLVAAKKLFLSYEYVCFIHDKKEKDIDSKEYVEAWVKNLWDNTLQSQLYIYNVLEVLEKERKLGMLVPLPPYGRDRGGWLNNSWGENYENVRNLASELGISANISYENPLISYSTVFWAKTKTLLKLFSKDWKYTDFPEEPIKDDGEINHAVERIMQYVVEDAGFETKIGLSSSFAEHFIEQLHGELKDLWGWMNKELGIRNYYGLDRYIGRVENIKKFGKKYTDIYLYGAGKVGKDCLKICRILDIFPKGFIVTEADDRYKEIENIPLFSISDFKFTDNMGVIVSVGEDYRKEIEKELKNREFASYIFF